MKFSQKVLNVVVALAPVVLTAMPWAGVGAIPSALLPQHGLGVGGGGGKLVLLPVEECPRLTVRQPRGQPNEEKKRNAVAYWRCGG